ncbi:MAG: hypothetical protein KatS3mg132_890 [Limisphaera sp.]|nr:MAG: hypothetical protein KatS3mg132_890 [Limisphaera sp.]
MRAAGPTKQRKSSPQSSTGTVPADDDTANRPLGPGFGPVVVPEPSPSVVRLPLRLTLLPWS